ncbi:hypothetical protein IEO21_10012 [Rhodonia placenta]|uniref:Retrovirus-related Pol polyprotein from transposon TNT 1-94-like beta-barrel domain-containing protein n=1 Tax=Rhodonia placenta TaxID=104341 RepID=A0A8H7TX64_9APHY|nr:hypothetical protein IEO21_10012 [Postia placenta]
MTDLVLQEAWHLRNYEALMQITLMLKDKPLSSVMHMEIAKDAWDALNRHYEGVGKQTITYLISDLFQGMLSNKIALENQLNAMLQKNQILASLGLILDESLIAVAMLISLLPSYGTLRTILMTQDRKLDTEKVINEVLTEEKCQKEGTSESVLLVRAGKGVKSPDKKDKKKKKKCTHCGYTGHTVDECCKLKASQSEAATKADNKDKSSEGKESAKVTSVHEVGFETLCLFLAKELLCNDALLHCWIIDSSASSHMSSHHEWFLHYRPLAALKQVYLGNEHHVLAQGIGQVIISASLEDSSINTGIIQNVLYIPDLNSNLLSVA